MSSRHPFVSLMVLLIAVAVPAAGDTGDVVTGCASGRIADALRELGIDVYNPIHSPFPEVPCGPESRCWNAKRTLLAELAAAHPFDALVQQIHQDLRWVPLRDSDRTERERLLDEYRHEAARRGESALHQYLVGRIEPDPVKARMHLERSLQLDPHFPWPHLRLALLGVQSEEQAALTHLDRFMKACPERTASALLVLYVAAMTSPADLEGRLAAVRAAVESKPVSDRVPDLPFLWQLEFRSADPSRFVALRERVRRDLDAIEREASGGDLLTAYALFEGRKLLPDEAARAENEREFVERFPCTTPAVEFRIEAAAGPESSVGEASDALASYEATVEWTQLCPDDFRFWHERFKALSRLGSAADGSRVLEDVLRYVDVAEGTGGRYRFRTGTPHVNAARLLLDRGIRPDVALELLAREEQQWSMLYGAPLVKSRPGADEADVHLTRFVRWLEHGVEKARALARMGQSSRARAELDRVGRQIAWIGQHDVSSPVEKLIEDVGARYRKALTETASERRDDSGGFQIPSPRAVPAVHGRPRLHDGAPPPVVLVSTGEGEEPGEWTRVERALPEFELTDAGGHAWTAEDLRGKVTFINLWATWCAPCRSEIPRLKALAGALGDEDDLLFLTWNTDAHPGLVVPFMAKYSLSYPVLYAARTIERHLGAITLPTNWIVAPDLTIRYEQKGFEAGDDFAWVDEVLELLSDVRDGRVEGDRKNPER